MTKIELILQELINRYPILIGCKNSISSSYEIMKTCFENGNKILCCGNGGSSADCDHIVGELMKSFLKHRKIPDIHMKRIKNIFPESLVHLQPALPAINLSSQTALITAYLNDCEPSMVYAQLLYGYAKEGDVLLAITTSGNSKNVLAAAKVARAIGVKVVGLTGKSGGNLKEFCDICIFTPETETYAVQELHLPVYHALCAMLEEWFYA